MRSCIERGSNHFELGQKFHAGEGACACFVRTQDLPLHKANDREFEMLRILCVLAFGLFVTTGAANAEPATQRAGLVSIEQAATYEHDMQRRLAMWRQRVGDIDERLKLEGASIADLASAWRQVAQGWQQLQTATATQWQAAALNLEDALRTLESAWQAQQEIEAETPPFFYAIDTATRMLT